MQVLYLGRAPRTKETLPDFREKCRVTRHSRVFRGLTGSQQNPGIWGVTNLVEGIYYFRYRERTRRRLILEADFEESRVVALVILGYMY